LILAHPFVKGFDQISYCATEEEVRAVAQGEISDVISSRKKEDMEGKEGVSPVYSTTFYIGLQIEDKPAGSTGPRRLDISYPTTEFTKLVKMWDKFDEATMGIVVRHIKRSALPDNVFDPGERPAKLVQKRVKGPGKSSNTSLDMPNKRQRSSQSTSDMPFKLTENGSTCTTPSLPAIAETYTSKDWSDKKSPQLPFGENVAVATGAIAAQ